MTNWRELQPGRELDRVIAERLGWTRIEAVEYGEYCIGVYYDFTYLRGESPGHVFKRIPQYSTDLNAAITLWEKGGGWSLHANYKADQYIAGYPDDDYGESIQYADTPALAICRALLAWKEAQS